MPLRSYISNLSKAWPEAEQRRVIHEWMQRVRPDAVAAEYQDILTRRGLQSRSPNLLPERATMLRPTSRRGGETICVAALGCLAVSPADLATVIAAAADRQATIEVVADGLTIPPNPSAAVQAAVQATWEQRRRQGLHEAGRMAGQRASVARRNAKVAAAVAKVEGAWSTDRPLADLAAEAGVTPKTLYKYLGRRSDARRARERKEKFNGKP